MLFFTGAVTALMPLLTLQFPSPAISISVRFTVLESHCGGAVLLSPAPHFHVSLVSSCSIPASLLQEGLLGYYFIHLFNLASQFTNFFGIQKSTRTLSSQHCGILSAVRACRFAQLILS